MSASLVGSEMCIRDRVRRCSPGGLRPPGLSLQSVHLSGPICGWLAKVGDCLLYTSDAADDM
eukprot:9789370-Alexandrium_andersonii.AAC.1